MENATKALLIAGAVAVALLILSLGMYFYNTATEGIDLSKLSQAQKDEFNKSWQMYEGTAIPGSQVNNLIQQVKNSNVKESRDGTGKVIELTISAAEAKLMDKNFKKIDTNGNANSGVTSEKVKTGMTFSVDVKIDEDLGLVTKIEIK